jgi:hypothetical protein
MAAKTRAIAFVADTAAHLPLKDRLAEELLGECDVQLYRWQKFDGQPAFDAGVQHPPK